MNKKLIVIVGLAGLITLLVFAGLAFAQTTGPFGRGMMGDGYGGGMMGGYGGMMGSGYGPGMMSGYGPGMMGGGYHGPMHSAMLDALANGLGLDRTELESRLSAGETLVEIAASESIGQAELSGIFGEARQAAMEQAVANGYMTQEQADWMLSHMSGSGFGPCPFTDNTPES